MPEPTNITAAQPNLDEVRANVASTKLGRELFRLAKEEIEQLPGTHHRRTWALLAYLIAEHTGTINDYPPPRSASAPIPKMNRDDAIIFEKWSLPFVSKYGATVGANPLSFLRWLLRKRDTESPFFEKLRAYLNSDRVAREDQSQPDDDDFANTED